MSNTADVPDRGPTFMAVTGVLTGIAFLLVVYRWIHGWTLRKAIYSDDILIACSMCVQIVTTIVGDLANHYGFGRHKADIKKSGGDLVVALKYFWLFQVFYKLVLCLTKLSFLAFYLRIFPSKQFHRICYLTMGVIICGVFGFVLATIFQCIPVRGSWEKNLHAQCINNAWFRWWWAGYNTATDIWICLLPMPLLARLQLDIVRKIGVMLMFTLGLFVCITSIIRITALVQSVATTDPTWGSWDALLWSAIEASTGIICACLPFLKHPIKQMFPKLFSSFDSKVSRSRPTYKLSALSGNRGHRSHNTREWQNLDSSRVGTGSVGGGSEDAIVPGHIMMKTDISLQTERMEESHYPENSHYPERR